ncbi:hydroxyacid oxidase 1 [Trichonephila inaurata madagascariensis]|uniref:Hydroxyacid oxidase 1 n=1 Tax=Trichonephila inaurata madagascariensis TaxID=2747483 RepID=A0A8X6XM73_9ARAC|nr:hydroxyacid oxidase 1 [Trichonephila inaurata madagascariensis]
MSKSSDFICVDDFEKYALRTLPRNAADYYRSGANEEQTLRENREAFKRLRLRPRFLRDVSKRRLNTSILGHNIPFPVCVAPSAMHRMAHPDGEIATVKEVLPEIVRAVAGCCEVYLDGGVRNGTDVLKALALGAKAVFIGRPILWGLAHSGESGVRKILQILKEEFDTAMALSGCATIDDIKPSLVVRQESYSRL